MRQGPSSSSRVTRIQAARELGDRFNGYPEEAGESLPPLLGLLAKESDPEVLEAIAQALGHMWDQRCLYPLIELINHPDRHVRLAATAGMLGAMGDSGMPEGVAALMGRMVDDDPEIRDWATMVLAQGGVDTPAVREALLARIYDPGCATAGEALVGLAKRGDPRMIGPLIDWFESKDVGTLIVEAALETADPRFHPFLRAMKDDGWEDNRELLDEALRSCASG